MVPDLFGNSHLIYGDIGWDDVTIIDGWTWWAPNFRLPEEAKGSLSVGCNLKRTFPIKRSISINE